MIENRFIYPLRIHIEDTDFGGVVYHSNYLKFMERARSEWGEVLGFGMAWQREHQIYLPVHSLTMEFLMPARVHEQVEVVSTIKSIRPASLIFDQYLRLKGLDDKILCKAEIKLACADYNMQACKRPAVPSLETIRRTLT